ncbi:MAG: MazG family protein, partial [Pseudonocardiales bacterium]|nr:MazG family protein [Pseudonocardiales bacterium]
MGYRVVVLSLRRPDVLGTAAVRALREASTVVADATVPEEIRADLGAALLDGEPPSGSVLLTTDPGLGADTAVIAAPPGIALLDAVAVMDRLRSPGGCPWDAEQTHASLLQYLVEECYELYDAIEQGDRDAMREELGDVLLQVLFHARVAAEEDSGFTIDDVAGVLVDKLVGRHPHVFAGTERVDTAARQAQRWEELKQKEKQRASSVDGVALGQPAVALAAKLTSRTARAGLPSELLPS